MANSRVVAIGCWWHPKEHPRADLKRALIAVAVAAAGGMAVIGQARSIPLATTTASPRPVVVAELFTSEGCSSCPPADAVLAQVTREPSAGVEVLPLAEHVDYWDGLGWHDRFSSAEFSVRQSTYDGDAFHRDPYTPQLVIDGRFERVGSDLDGVQRAIQQAARTLKAGVGVAVLRDQDGRLTVDIHVTVPEALVLGERVDAVVAVTEDHLVTDVRGGENRGRILRHESVVRQMRAVAQLPSATREWQTRTPLVLAPDWNPANLRVTCFLQDRATRHIVGAAATKVRS